MQLHSYLIDALDHVLAWDLPDELCPEAISAEAGRLARLDSDQPAEVDLD